MPTYEYECKNCGHYFEAFHSMSAIPLTDCPRCCKNTLIRLIGKGGAVIVKGTATPCRGGRRIIPKDRLGEGKNKTEKPFWRDGPVNKKILKNPEKYIKEGVVD